MEARLSESESKSVLNTYFLYGLICVYLSPGPIAATTLERVRIYWQIHRIRHISVQEHGLLYSAMDFIKP